MKQILIIVVFGISVISCNSKIDNKPQKTADERSEILDSLFQKAHEDGTFNGNVLIADKGNIIFDNSYGLANETTKEVLGSNTIFNLASLSKQFTALGIVLLQKDGKLDYEDDFTKYIPELKAYEGITLLDLLVHRSGLPDYMELADTQKIKPKKLSNEEAIQLMADKNPQTRFPTGERFQYSNTGYLLLASIIERVSGKTYAEFLEENIFEPANMGDTYVTGYEGSKLENAEVATGYIATDSLGQKITADDMGDGFFMVFLNGIYGDGGINSTTHDLLKWDRWLYTNNRLNDEDKAKIFSSYPTDSNQTNYGFGWNVRATDDFGKKVYHSGNWRGFSTYIERFIDHDKTIIILQNNALPKTLIPNKNARRILFGLAVEKPIDLAPEIMDEYTGTYVDSNGNERNIVLEDGKLFVEFGPQRRQELVPIYENKFILYGFSPEVTYTFERSEDGPMQCQIQQLEHDVNISINRIEK
ncbi:MAG: serine hydrolase [Allomuricauda sp.]